MRYLVQRQDETGYWQPMANHDTLDLAKELLTDKCRRILDTQTGTIMQMETESWVILRAVRFIGWRAFLALVVMPSSVVGTVLLALSLNGQAPVKTALEGFIQYAESSVRPAPLGTVLVTECVNSPTEESIKPPVICDSTAPKAVPVNQVVAEAQRTVSTIYLVLVAISFGAVALGGRQFFNSMHQAN